MCSNVIFHDLDSRTVFSQGELAAIIGQQNIVMDGGGVSPSGGIYDEAEFCSNGCLCSVNLPATAEKAGYHHSRDDMDGHVDPFDYHWRTGGNHE